jgi:hypothetical protein
MIDIRSAIPATRRARLFTALSAALVVAAAAITFSVRSAPAADAASCSSTYLSLGSRGTCVKQLQTNLGGLTTDGIYGKATQSRVRAFQQDAGLAVDGKVGPQTWTKLGKIGKAIAWKYGLTLYMCKTATRFQFSTWNNSSPTAYWRLFSTKHYLDGDAKGNKVAVLGTIDDSPETGESFYVWHADQPKHSTKNVRNYTRSTLPTCG